MARKQTAGKPTGKPRIVRESVPIEGEGNIETPIAGLKPKPIAFDQLGMALAIAEIISDSGELIRWTPVVVNSFKEILLIAMDHFRDTEIDTYIKLCKSSKKLDKFKNEQEKTRENEKDTGDNLEKVFEKARKQALGDRSEKRSEKLSGQPRTDEYIPRKRGRGRARRVRRPGAPSVQAECYRSKKAVTLRFLPELLGRVDEAARAEKLDRTAWFTRAAEQSLKIK